MHKNIGHTLFAIVGSLVIVALFVVVSCFCESTRYNRRGVVVSHNSANVVVEDESGNLWAFEAKEWIPNGMRLVMTMDTNGTEHYIYDDEIISIYFYEDKK